jgi:hypothetical protein
MAEGWAKADAPDRDDLTIKEMVRDMQGQLDRKFKARRAATSQNITVSRGASYLLAYTLIMVSHRYVPATASEKWSVSLHALHNHVLMDEPGHQPCPTEPRPRALISASAAQVAMHHTRFSTISTTVSFPLSHSLVYLYPYLRSCPIYSALLIPP